MVFAFVKAFFKHFHNAHHGLRALAQDTASKNGTKCIISIKQLVLQKILGSLITLLHLEWHHARIIGGRTILERLIFLRLCQKCFIGGEMLPINMRIPSGKQFIDESMPNYYDLKPMTIRPDGHTANPFIRPQTLVDD